MIICTTALQQYIDINECDIDSDGCEQICINKVPLFDCLCYSGFRSHGDKFCSGNQSFAWFDHALKCHNRY